MQGLVIDLFAGGGGASVGIEAALGRPIDVAINHSPTALAVHADNHPHTKHLTSDIWEVQPEAVVAGRPVDLLWASPDCTHHSVAKAGKPRDAGIRSLAWVVVDWAKRVKPAVIFLENVPEFASLGAAHRGRRARQSSRWRDVPRLEEGARGARLRRRLPGPRCLALRRTDETATVVPRREKGRQTHPVADADARAGLAGGEDGGRVHRLEHPPMVNTSRR